MERDAFAKPCESANLLSLHPWLFTSCIPSFPYSMVLRENRTMKILQNSSGVLCCDTGDLDWMLGNLSLGLSSPRMGFPGEVMESPLLEVLKSCIEVVLRHMGLLVDLVALD